MKHLLDELERVAYINRDPMCIVYGTILEKTTDNEDLEDLIEVAHKEGFDAGKLEGLGLDTSEMIADRDSLIDTLTLQIKRYRELLLQVSCWLDSVDCKTVGGRKDFNQRLSSTLVSLPRY